MKASLIYSILALLLGSCTLEIDYSDKEYAYLIMNPAVHTQEDKTTFNATIKNYKEQWISEAGFIWQNANGTTYTQEVEVSPTGTMTASITSDLVAGTKYTCKAFASTAQTRSYSDDIEFINKTEVQASVDHLYPTTGYDYETITIVGSGFSRNASAIDIQVEGLSARVLSANEDTIRFQMPPSPFTDKVDVELRVHNKKKVLVEAYTIQGPTINNIENLTRHSYETISLQGTHLIGNGKTSSLTCTDVESKKTYDCEILSRSNQEVVFRVPTPKDLLAHYTMSIVYTNGNKRYEVEGSFEIAPYWREFTLQKFYTSNLGRGFTHNNDGYVYLANKMYKYETSSDTWSIIPNSKAPAYPNNFSEYIYEDGDLYVFGGIKNGEYTKAMMVYNVASNTWKIKDDIPFIFRTLAHEKKGRYTYIVSSFEEVWKCDFSENEYIKLGMFQELTGYGYKAAFVANDEIYVSINNKTYRYDESNDRWPLICNSIFETDSYYNSSTVHFTLNNTGYLLNKGKDLYRFNTETLQWDFVIRYPYSNYPTNDKAVFVVGNKAYIIITDSTYEPVFYIYEE